MANLSNIHFRTYWTTITNTAMNNATTTGWNSEPQGRGTIGLVWSCLATIFICVWSALHLNLPGIDESNFERMGREAGHVVMGLLAPEWLAFFALGDVEEVRELKHRVSSFTRKMIPHT
jgi:hypothetical protein